MVEDLLSLSPDELTVYLTGGIILIVIPPLVGLISSYILFGTRAENTGAFLRRLILVAALCLGVTFGLGYTGVSLIVPASTEAIWVTLGMAFVFGLLGAGRLYWSDDQEN